MKKTPLKNALNIIIILLILIILNALYFIFAPSILDMWNNIDKNNDNNWKTMIETVLDEKYKDVLVKSEKEWIVLMYEIKDNSENKKYFFIDLSTKVESIERYILLKTKKQFETTKEMQEFYKILALIGKDNTIEYKNNIKNILKDTFTDKETNFILKNL